MCHGILIPLCTLPAEQSTKQKKQQHKRVTGRENRLAGVVWMDTPVRIESNLLIQFCVTLMLHLVYGYAILRRLSGGLEEGPHTRRTEERG